MVIGPTPLKPSDQVRRAMPVSADLLGEDGASSSDDDVRGSTAAALARADVKGKGKAAQAGKPRMLFAGGKSSLIAATDGAGDGKGSTLHPFFTSRASQPPPPPVKAEAKPTSASEPADGSEGGGDGGQWTSAPTTAATTKKARPASPPATTGATKPPPAKKARKYAPSFGKINMTAAAKAKAEQAASRLEADGGGADAGASDESEDEVLRRVVQSHLLGKAGQNRTGRGRAPVGLSPVKPRPAARRSTATGDGEPSDMDEDEPQHDAGEEGFWQSDLDDDLLVDRASPRKKQNTLYGLPQAYDDDDDGGEPQTLVEASDGEDDDDPDAAARRSIAPAASAPPTETHDLPPHLLALLSLRSPQIASARTAKRTADTFAAIFAHTKASEEEPPASSSLLAPRGRSGRSAKSKRGSAPRPPSPPPPPPAQAEGQQRPGGAPHRERKPKGEVWGLGDVGGSEMDEIEMKDDEWDSEPEGWKATGPDDDDW